MSIFSQKPLKYCIRAFLSKITDFFTFSNYAILIINICEFVLSNIMRDRELSSTLISSNNTKSEKVKEIFSTEEVKKILGSDFKEIKTLCQKVNVTPKKDSKTGQTFFFRNDIELLKKIKDLHKRTDEISRQQKSKQLLVQNTIVKTNSIPSETEEVQKLINAVVDTRENVVNRITKVIEDKLDGLDDIIVELVKSKTEIEKLRQKLDELTKENYKLKKDNDSYKSAGFGLYVKRKPQNNLK